MRSNLPQPVPGAPAANMRAPCATPAPVAARVHPPSDERICVTTYTLRKGSPEKTKTDAVVIGVVSSAKGLVPAPGGEGVAGAYGRRFAPLLATLGFNGKPGEVAKVPTGDVLKSPLLVLVGLGAEDKLTPDAVRRAAGVAARTLSNAASVALALPAGDADHVRAVVEGCALGSYAFADYKTSTPDENPGEVVVLSPVARSKEARAAVELAEAVATAVAAPATGSTRPPGDLTPPAFADAVVAAAKDVTGRLSVEVMDEKALAAGGFGGIIGVGRASANPPRLVQLSYTPRGRDRAPRAGRQGHHLRLRRPLDQAGRRDDDHEVRHGRRRRGHRRHPRDRRARPAGHGDLLRPDGREHGLRGQHPSR